MAWLSGMLAAACLAASLLHLLCLAVLRRDVGGEASGAAMGAGMAAMFSPLGDPVPAPLWATVFVLLGGWCAVSALRAGTRGGAAGHHVISSGAMLFMLAGGHSPAPGAGGPEQAGHLAHGGGPDGALGLGSLAAIVLAGYFAWHVLRCADRVRVGGPSRPSPAPASRPALLARGWSPAGPSRSGRGCCRYGPRRPRRRRTW